MSTRCQVRVIYNGYPANFYHHCDGYLSGVGTELRHFLTDDVTPSKDKGIEPEKVNDIFHVIEKLSRDGAYEVTFHSHWDIEYFYVLDFDNFKFKAYHVKYGDGEHVWPRQGQDEYDPYKPWYFQMPATDAEYDLLADSLDD